MRRTFPTRFSLHQTQDTKRYEQFAKEWNETLQHMRTIATRVSDKAIRPDWIAPDVPRGVQADQFLHAYYYKVVRDGNAHPFEEHHDRNKSNLVMRASHLQW